MNLFAFWGALEAGLMFGFVGLGTWLTFKLLRFPDVTIEGSFPLGAAVAATLIAGGVNPFLATGCAALSGAAAGGLTAYLNVRLKILHILAGILVSVALYSVNLRVMGRPNLSLIGQDTVFSWLNHLPLAYDAAVVLFLFLLLGVAVALLYGFLGSEVGLAVRATGINERMAAANGIRTDAAKWLGLMLGNALAALGGALFAQTQGAADVSMGVGVIVIGFAAVIGGAAVLPGRGMLVSMVSAVAGAALYQLIVAVALNAGGVGINPSDLNIVTAILVAFAMVAPDSRLLKRKPRARHMQASEVKS